MCCPVWDIYAGEIRRSPIRSMKCNGLPRPPSPSFPLAPTGFGRVREVGAEEGARPWTAPHPPRRPMRRRRHPTGCSAPSLRTTPVPRPPSPLAPPLRNGPRWSGSRHRDPLAAVTAPTHRFLRTRAQPPTHRHPVTPLDGFRLLPTGGGWGGVSEGRRHRIPPRRPCRCVCVSGDGERVWGGGVCVFGWLGLGLGCDCKTPLEDVDGADRCVDRCSFDTSQIEENRRQGRQSILPPAPHISPLFLSHSAHSGSPGAPPLTTHHIRYCHPGVSPRDERERRGGWGPRGPVQADLRPPSPADRRRPGRTPLPPGIPIPPRAPRRSPTCKASSYAGEARGRNQPRCRPGRPPGPTDPGADAGPGPIPSGRG